LPWPSPGRRLAQADAPEELPAFVSVEGLDGTSAPATQRDLWVWIHGSGEDVALDVAPAVGASLARVATLELTALLWAFAFGRI